jgi:hypothetical protein
LLDVPQLDLLGLYQVLPLLDVTKPSGYYSNQLRWHTLLQTLSSGKTRLYHTGELVEDEFARILGVARYPQRSDLHAYFDRIIAVDQQQADEGIVEEERIIGKFVGLAQQQLATIAAPGVGRAIYVDPHVMALHSKKPIARTKHGTQKRVVKALVRVQVVSANQLGRALTFKLGQANFSFHQSLEEMVDLTSWVTGESVELVGVDRGALSKAILSQFRKREIGLVVWSKDSPTIKQALALVPKDKFIDAEYETVRRADGLKVQRLKTRVADVPEMVINKDGDTCRTIVVEDVRNRKRIGIHAVGQTTVKMSARQLLRFMRGKQWVEEDIKQSIAWGGDAFCGGQIKNRLRRERPNECEVKQLIKKCQKLKKSWRANLAEEASAVADWQNGKMKKRQLNDLLKGIRRRRKAIKKNWQQTQELIRWGQTGIVPKRQLLWEVDTRKMSLMTQFQMFARLARKESMTLIRRFLKQAVIESAVASHDSTIDSSLKREIEKIAQKKVAGMPWGQLESRLFAQGGWVHKDEQQRVISVILKPIKNCLLQRALQLLCEHLNKRQPIMRCEDGQYTLSYSCQARFERKKSVQKSKLAS